MRSMHARTHTQCSSIARESIAANKLSIVPSIHYSEIAFLITAHTKARLNVLQLRIKWLRWFVLIFPLLVYHCYCCCCGWKHIMTTAFCQFRFDLDSFVVVCERCFFCVCTGNSWCHRRARRARRARIIHSWANTNTLFVVIGFDLVTIY